MATLTKGHTFASGDIVTATKLNNLVDSATISGIVNADIDAAAAIAASKLALSGAITDTQLATGAVTGAAGGGKLAASAITGQTTIADALADTDEFLVHDASASALRKVAYSNIAPSVTAAKLNGVAKDGSGNNLSAGSSPIFGCRAWVSFDATKDTTGAASTLNTNRLILGRGNVSSVLRNAVGDYTITFTEALPDEKYAAVGTVSTSAGDSTTFHAPWTTAQTSSAIRCFVRAAGVGGIDKNPVSCAIFR